MTWITVFVMLLSFLTAKKKGASTEEALGIAALAGGATYGLAYHTDWGEEYLLPLGDKVDSTIGDWYDGSSTPTVTADGQSSEEGNSSVWSWLPWVGGALVGSSDSGRSVLLWIAIGLGAVLLLR